MIVYDEATEIGPWQWLMMCEYMERGNTSRTQRLFRIIRQIERDLAAQYSYFRPCSSVSRAPDL